jgi:GIY-YIG catalytic domain-containing protein
LDSQNKEKMIKLFDIFEHYKINPSKVKLVRHGNKELPILETYRTNRAKFEAYQSFQAPKKFSGAYHIAVFAPTIGTTALFLGLWDIRDIKSSFEFTKKIHSIIDKFNFPEEWHTITEWYDLVRNSKIDELSERLVIDWGKSTVAWVQTKDKKIIEIKSKNSIGDFISYDEVLLKFSDLKKLMTEDSSNASWVSALSAVNGIYLIRDQSTGLLYVGSAYGTNGIFGRWATYSRNGHGGNKKLKSLNPVNFEFSILEVAPPTSSADEVIVRENRWKNRLGTRLFGLNDN